MIAADSSSLVSFLNEEEGGDVLQLLRAIQAGQLVLPPAVVTEVLSGAPALDAILSNVALLPVQEGYWQRAGVNRRLLAAKGLKAKLGDALIAQSCIDHDVPLITRDGDFRHFAKHCGLKLA
ncbi:MAG TPA: PIN domain-containing protein [Rhizomicrobium sp.]|nr:PIN domain-containing protein [Rhizomicrobium sp.]